MFEDYVPKHEIGCLCPLAVIDTYAYEFYKLAPKDVMTVMVPLGLQEFLAQDVERVFASVDEKDRSSNGTRGRYYLSVRGSASHPCRIRGSQKASRSHSDKGQRSRDRYRSSALSRRRSGLE